MTSGPAVAVDVLGPVRVRVGGAEVEVGGARPRTLLAALALHAGQPVPVTDLIAALWADEPPPSAEATLRVYVSRLRKLMGEALRRDRAGYVLDASVDADRFRELTTAAREAEAQQRATALAEALALWRGAPLADVVASGSLRQAGARLIDARRDAQHAHAVALLEAGSAEAGIEQLRALVGAKPDREVAAGDLMRALYRAGRQQESLEVYRLVREALLERAGLEPGPALQALHASVLAQDPALLQPPAATPPPPAAAVAEPVAVVPSARTTNLPLPLTSFVGRVEELQTLGRLIDDHRLITLTGPGGTGKTRLALEACRRRDDADGPWLVELASLEEPALLPNVVAQVMGIGVQDGRTATEVLAGALEQRSAVLLLDNCEHVLDGTASLVEVLLSRCLGVRVVATSREPLGVPGERIFTVGTLPVVERSPQLIATDGDAMRLFLDRARQVLPDLAPDPSVLEVVRRICSELDGLPLAIELAAAELRALSPSELAEQLADRFAVLTGGPRTAQPRQRTLQTTVAWSVDLLDPAQRDLFAKLSVFVGGFDLDAVRSVCGPQAAALVPDLVDKSLVEVDTSAEPRRYRMLETLRQYGASLLDEQSQWRIHDRHARWCAALVTAAGEGLRGHSGPVWERRIDREIGNIRVGLRTAITDGEWSTALLMADSLWWYWFRRARLDEGRRWLDEITALEHRRDAVLASAHYGRAFLAFFANETGVEEHHDIALDIARETGDDALLARLLVSKAYRWAIHGRMPEALAMLEEGLAALPDDAPGWVKAECAFPAGQVARINGDHALAQERLEHALALADDCGHRWAVTVALWVLAEQALDVDQPREAARLLARALELARADVDRGAVLGTLRSLAGVAARLGMPTDGARLLAMVGGLARGIGMDVDQMERADAARTTAVIAAALRPEALARATADGEGQPIGAALALADRLLAAAKEPV